MAPLGPRGLLPIKTGPALGASQRWHVLGSPVCVFEWRYGSSEMRQLLSRDSIVEAMKRVEAALAEALEKAGIAPRGTAASVRAALEKVRPEEVYEAERRETGHDVAALVFLAARRGGEKARRWIHYGATSNDIVDTAWALLLRDALALLKGRLREVVEKLSRLALETEDVVMAGRTHGQHAVPITLGFKLANHVYELARSYERICCLEERLLRVKMGGAVGTMAAWGERGPEVRRLVAESLGLGYHPVTTQVAPRDGYAELAAALAILASQLDRLAVEVRELARPEIGEVWEERGAAIGSSAMPQKANPVTAERVSGLARAARSLVAGFLENIVLWHERDLSNSSFERYGLPHLLLLLDQMLIDASSLLDRLGYSPERMRKNLESTRYTVLTEALMNALIGRGLGREEAYRLARAAARKALEEGKPLPQAAAEIEEIAATLPREEILSLRPEDYLGSARRLVHEALDYAEKALNTC